MDLSRQHQMVFALCCCERMLPSFRDFAEDDGWEDATVLNRAVDRLWDAVLGNELSDKEQRTWQKTVSSLALSEKTSKSRFLGIAVNTASAVWYTVDFQKDAKASQLRDIARWSLRYAKEWYNITSDFNLSRNFEESDIQLKAITPRE